MSDNHLLSRNNNLNENDKHDRNKLTQFNNKFNNKKFIPFDSIPITHTEKMNFHKLLDNYLTKANYETLFIMKLSDNSNRKKIKSASHNINKLKEGLKRKILKTHKEIGQRSVNKKRRNSISIYHDVKKQISKAVKKKNVFSYHEFLKFKNEKDGREFKELQELKQKKANEIKENTEKLNKLDKVKELGFLRDPFNKCASLDNSKGFLNFFKERHNEKLKTNSSLKSSDKNPFGSKGIKYSNTNNFINKLPFNTFNSINNYSNKNNYVIENSHLVIENNIKISNPTNLNKKTQSTEEDYTDHLKNEMMKTHSDQENFLISTDILKTQESKNHKNSNFQSINKKFFITNTMPNQNGNKNKDSENIRRFFNTNTLNNTNNILVNKKLKIKDSNIDSNSNKNDLDRILNEENQTTLLSTQSQFHSTQKSFKKHFIKLKLGATETLKIKKDGPNDENDLIKILETTNIFDKYKKFFTKSSIDVEKILDFHKKSSKNLIFYKCNEFLKENRKIKDQIENYEVDAKVKEHLKNIKDILLKRERKNLKIVNKHVEFSGIRINSNGMISYVDNKIANLIKYTDSCINMSDNLVKKVGINSIEKSYKKYAVDADLFFEYERNIMTDFTNTETRMNKIRKGLYKIKHRFLEKSS